MRTTPFVLRMMFSLAAGSLACSPAAGQESWVNPPKQERQQEAVRVAGVQPDAVVDPGVVDQRIDAAVAGDGGLDRRPALLGAGQLREESVGPAARRHMRSLALMDLLAKSVPKYSPFASPNSGHLF
jgi:hypothetical protein